jgi:hypothetical protein
MAPRALEADRILLRLADEDVEYVVVGMMAGVLQGVPTTTWDLDIVHRRTEENVERLLGVLGELDACARHHPKRVRPARTHLIGPGHVLLETRFGDLDCLGAIDGERAYEELLAHSHVVDLRHGDSDRSLHSSPGPRRHRRPFCWADRGSVSRTKGPAGAGRDTEGHSVGKTRPRCRRGA